VIGEEMVHNLRGKCVEAEKEVNSTVGRIRRKMQTESMVQYRGYTIASLGHSINITYR